MYEWCAAQLKVQVRTMAGSSWQSSAMDMLHSSGLHPHACYENRTIGMEGGSGWHLC